MGKLLGAWSRNYLRGAGLYLIAAVIVIPLACCLIIAPLAFVNGGNLGDGATALILLIPTALFLFIIVGGSIGFLYWSISRRAHWLDEALAPFGLEGKPYGISGRQYHGTYQGRQLDIMLYRGPSFSMFVGTPLKTKFSIGERSKVGLAISRAFKREPLETAGTQLEKLAVYAHDPAWVQALIAKPKAAAAIERLILGESDFLIQQLHLYPDTFFLKLYQTKGLFKFQIRPEQVQAWFNDILVVAGAAESLPVPQEVLESSRMEQAARTGEAAKWGLWIGVGIVFALLFCGFVPMVFFMALAMLSG